MLRLLSKRLLQWLPVPSLHGDSQELDEAAGTPRAKRRRTARADEMPETPEPVAAIYMAYVRDYTRDTRICCFNVLGGRVCMHARDFLRSAFEF